MGIHIPKMQNMLFLNVCSYVILRFCKTIFAFFGGLSMPSGRGALAVALLGVLGPHAAPGSRGLTTPLALAECPSPLDPPPGMPPEDCGLDPDFVLCF